MKVLLRKFWGLWHLFLRLSLAAMIGFGAVMAPVSQAAADKRVRAAIIVDANTNTVLYAQSADDVRSPASLTKIMTLYVLFAYLRAGRLDLDSNLKVSKHAANQSPTKLGLKPGSTIPVRDAIKALVTKSANDAAAVIAENLGGTEENFARIMTKTAHNLGMNNTTFRNASGLPNGEQVTTARDMAILALRVMRDYPEYYGVFETRYFTYKGRRYRNHNRLLFGYTGTDGIKTGYTRASGFNLTASVKRSDKHLVGVVLGGRTGALRDAAMRKLFDGHWAKASSKKSTGRSLIASLLGSPSPPPPSRKPAYALAGASSTPDTIAQGDLTGPGDTVRTSPSLNGPTQQDGDVAQSRYSGSYHVQVGAFTSPADAQNRLGLVQQRATKLLDGHLPFTATFMKDSTEWYRARFAGFSKTDARSTCAALKRMKLECIAMSAE